MAEAIYKKETASYIKESFSSNTQLPSFDTFQEANQPVATTACWIY